MFQLNIPKEVYFQTPGISVSSLKSFADCPAKYKAERDGLIKREETAAMRFGTLLHALILEGREEYYVKPEGMNFASTAGKEWKLNHSDKIIITTDEHYQLERIESAVRKHKHAGSLLQNGQSEVSLFGKDRETGMAIKGRADYITSNSIVDIKTIHAADNRSCARAIADFNYHMQAAFYLELARQNGVDARDFYFIFIEKGDFPLINVRRLNQNAIDLGEIEYKKLLRDLKQAQETDVWPDYSGTDEQPAEIDLPTWKYTDISGCELIGATEIESETSNDFIP